MGRRDLPDMHAQSPRAYISGKSRLPMLQVICITSAILKIKIKPTITLICCAYIKNARFTCVSLSEYGLWIKQRSKGSFFQDTSRCIPLFRDTSDMYPYFSL